MKKISIIGGAGHIGFPLGLYLASKKNSVYLYDINKKLCDQINSSKSPHYEKGINLFIKKYKKYYVAGNNVNWIKNADVIIVCLGTPVNNNSSPKVKEFLKVIKDIKSYINNRQLIIIRSSVFPGTIEKIKKILISKNKQIAYCPERILQGSALAELPKLTQIVSGINEKSIKQAKVFFEKNITKKIIVTGTFEAELIKLFSNALRYINFAISNEFYTICKTFGVSYEKIRKDMMTGYERNNNLFKAGFAAGPCLVKDTMQLNSLLNKRFDLGKSALKVNQNFPNFLIKNLEKTYNIKNKVVGILGMAFKSDVDDIRDSLSLKLIKILKNKKIKFLKSDEYFKDKQSVSKEFLVKNSDIIIVAVPHKNYKNLSIKKNKILIDTWNIINK
mgnify:FL=1